jgi:hypothetical protein
MTKADNRETCCQSKVVLRTGACSAPLAHCVLEFSHYDLVAWRDTQR